MFATAAAQPTSAAHAARQLWTLGTAVSGYRMFADLQLVHAVNVDGRNTDDVFIRHRDAAIDEAIRIFIQPAIVVSSSSRGKESGSYFY